MSQLSPGAPVTAQRLSNEVIILAWDDDGRRRGRAATLALNGANVPPPIACLTAPIEHGGVRQMIAFRIADGAAFSGPIDIANRDGDPLIRAAIDLSPTQLPDFEAKSLLKGLENAGVARLARFLLETCSGAFHLQRDSVYTNGMAHLVDALNGNPDQVTACASVGNELILCKAAVSNGIAPLQSAVLVARGRVQPLPFTPEVAQDGKARRGSVPAWLMLAEQDVDAENTVVIFGKGGLAVRRQTGTPHSLPSILDWLRRAGAASGPTANYVLDKLAQRPNRTGAAAPLVREIAALYADRSAAAPASPVGLSIHSCVATASGLFIAGRIADRQRLIRAIQVRGGGFAAEAPVAALACTEGNLDTAAGMGFLALASGMRAPEPNLMRFSLILHSGVCIAGPSVPALDTGDNVRQAIFGAAAKAMPSPSTIERIIGPALDGLPNASAHEAALRAELTQFGRAYEAPKISLILPFAGTRAALITQAGALCTQRGIPTFEIIRVLDRPEARAGAERSLDHVWKCFGLASSLLSVPASSDAASASAAAMRHARGDCVVFLGGHVVPDQASSLARITERVLERSHPTVCGGRVLYPDRSLQSPSLVTPTDDGERFTLEIPVGEFDVADPGTQARTGFLALSADAVAAPRALVDRIGVPSGGFFTTRWRDADFSRRAVQAGAGIVHEREASFIDFAGAIAASHRGTELADAIDARQFARQWAGLAEHAPDRVDDDLIPDRSEPTPESIETARRAA